MKKYTISILVVIFIASLAVAVFVTMRTGMVRTTTGGYIAAFTKDDLIQAMKYIAIEDKKAFKSMYDQKRATPLAEGIKVRVEEISWGKVRIRPIGHTGSVWTVREAIKK